MSAVPGDFMRDPAEHGKSNSRDDAGRQADEESGSTVWQWLAIAVLLACWVAEATLCAGQGF